jgi:hypothetical protein
MIKASELRKNIDFKVLARKDGQLLMDNYKDEEAQLWQINRKRSTGVLEYGNTSYEFIRHALKEDFEFFGVLDMRPLRA